VNEDCSLRICDFGYVHGVFFLVWGALYYSNRVFILLLSLCQICIGTNDSLRLALAAFLCPCISHSVVHHSLARYIGDDSVDAAGEVSPLTQYVSTRWFRAPELVLCRDAVCPAALVVSLA